MLSQRLDGSSQKLGLVQSIRAPRDVPPPKSGGHTAASRHHMFLVTSNTARAIGGGDHHGRHEQTYALLSVLRR
ncbi:hypothetical protein A2J03_19925 [Rhodococcus sp. EPR-157]|nr:hypothetical protein A2J03_19925 [Rhodococcus sp. EPR-157]